MVSQVAPRGGSGAVEVTSGCLIPFTSWWQGCAEEGPLPLLNGHNVGALLCVFGDTGLPRPVPAGCSLKLAQVVGDAAVSTRVPDVFVVGVRHVWGLEDGLAQEMSKLAWDRIRPRLEGFAGLEVGDSSNPKVGGHFPSGFPFVHRFFRWL